MLLTKKCLSVFFRPLRYPVSHKVCQMRDPVVGNKITFFILLFRILSARSLKSNPLSNPPRKIVSTLFPRISKAAIVVSGIVDKASL